MFCWHVFHEWIERSTFFNPHLFLTRSNSLADMQPMVFGFTLKKLSLHVVRYVWVIEQVWAQDIYLINQARGPYWENIGPRSWQYGSSAARSVQKRPRADILPVRSRASLVYKSFITRLKKAKTAKTQGRDHSRQCPVQYLENIGPAIEHFDWLILAIGPPTGWVV